MPRSYNLSKEEDSDEEYSSDESVAAPLCQPTSQPSPTAESSQPSSQPSSNRRSTKTKSAARTNQAGLDLTLQKGLAQDILSLFNSFEQFQNDYYACSKVCDRKEGTCGAANSKERARVRQKLKSWKKFTKKEYQALLKDLGIWLDFETETLAPPQQPQAAATSPQQRPPVHQSSSIRARSKSTANMSNKNDVGSIIVLKLPIDMYFVMAWVDSTLDNTILEVNVDDTGYNVMKRSKKPSAEQDAAQMLAEMGYNWACDGNNVVTATLTKELNKIQARRKSTNEDPWTETVLCTLDEEVLKGTHNECGAPDAIENVIDVEGRQRISFFLKMKKACDTAAPTFRNNNANMAGAAPNSAPSGAAAPARVPDIAAQLQQITDQLRQEQMQLANQMRQEQQQALAELNNQHGSDMRALIGELRGMIHQGGGSDGTNMNVDGGGGPVPDQAGSGGGGFAQ